MKIEELSRRITEWAEKGIPALPESLVSALAEYLYFNMDRYRLEWKDEDRKRDFFSWLYPRFSRIIEKFDPARASFSTYLYWNVRMSWKSFIRSSFSAQALNRVIEAEERTRILCLDAENHENDRWVSTTNDRCIPYSMEPFPHQVGRQTAKQKDIWQRKILLLACKSSPFLDDSDIMRVSRATGLSEEYLRDKIEELRTACGKKDATVRQSRERVNALYYRVQRCKYEMKYLESDSSRYADLKRECETCERRLAGARAMASRHLMAPSNRLLARTLGIPRGTVDSALASARPAGYDGRQ